MAFEGIIPMDPTQQDVILDNRLLARNTGVTFATGRAVNPEVAGLVGLDYQVGSTPAEEDRMRLKWHIMANRDLVVVVQQDYAPSMTGLLAPAANALCTLSVDKAAPPFVIDRMQADVLESNKFSMFGNNVGGTYRISGCFMSFDSFNNTLTLSNVPGATSQDDTPYDPIPPPVVTPLLNSDDDGLPGRAVNTVVMWPAGTTWTFPSCILG